MLRSRYLKSRLLGAFLAVPAAVGVSLPAAPRAAASLTQITNFGTHPTPSDSRSRRGPRSGMERKHARID
jgi:hypothetical protein